MPPDKFSLTRTEWVSFPFEFGHGHPESQENVKALNKVQYPCLSGIAHKRAVNFKIPRDSELPSAASI